MMTSAASWNQLLTCETEAGRVRTQTAAEAEEQSDPAGWWITTSSSANESGSALNPFPKSIKKANKSWPVTGLARDHSRQSEGVLSEQQAQARGHYMRQERRECI